MEALTLSNSSLRRQGILRHSPWDALLIVLSLGHGLMLWLAPGIVVLAVGIWWNSNTIAHNFLHRPFFRSEVLNRGYSIYLSLLLGIPQGIWRDRHLAHHAGCTPMIRWNAATRLESGLVLALWAALLGAAPRFFVTVYVPGYLLGLALCFLQGYFEHAGSGTISHYGRTYNRLFFNDGYHVEHHRRPALHWRELPSRPAMEASASRWPAVLRWLDWISLEQLERLVLRRPALQRFVLHKHEQAFRRLLAGMPAVRRVTIVGGGLFPRTALILGKLLPEAALTVLDASASNLLTATRWLPEGVAAHHRLYEPGHAEEADLVVIPLAFRGDRQRVYENPARSRLLVHDWFWVRRGRGATVSWLLLKRINLVEP